MKKTLLFFMALFAVTLCACTDTGIEQTSDNTETIQTNQTIPSQSTEGTDYQVQYIRTDGYDEGTYPETVAVTSLAELYDYFDSNKYRHDLWTRTDPASDTTIGFIDAVSQYDAAYFDDNALLFVVLREGSGSFRHRVTGITETDGVMTVSIDRLMPECFTDDEAVWHIIIEMPQDMLNGQEVAVDISDVPVEADTTGGDTQEVTISSGDVTVTPFAAIRWSETYDPETDTWISEESEMVFIDMLVDKIPELTLAEDFAVNVPNDGRVEQITVYDEQFSVFGTYDNITAGKLMLMAPGTYYLSIAVEWTGDYVEAAQANNSSAYYYYVKLILTDQQYGLASVIEEMGGFDLASISKAVVYTLADDDNGGLTPVSIDNGEDGLVRLLTLLRVTSAGNVDEAQAATGWTQVIRLYGEDSTDILMTIKPTEDGLYISTSGQYFSADAPPWLFEQMVEAAIGGRLIPRDEAISFAYETVKQSSYGDYITSESDVSAQITGTEYGYEWQVIFDGQKKIMVRIGNYYLIEIEDLE